MLAEYFNRSREKMVAGVSGEFEKQGTCFKLRVKQAPSPDEPKERLKRPPRGCVVEFTAASRRRMLETFARLDPRSYDNCVERPKFITLTYGKEYPDGEGAKRHLRALFERIRRRWPHASAIWRLEYQRRGAPHFHLVFFGLPFLPFKDLRDWWEDVIHWDTGKPGSINGPQAHSTAHVRIEIKAIQCAKQLTYYVAKYCAKTEKQDTGEETPENSSFLVNASYLHAGRWWGIHNRTFLPWGRLTVARIRGGQWLFKLRRAAKKIYKRINKNKQVISGFTLYLSNPDKFFDWAVILSLGPVQRSYET